MGKVEVSGVPTITVQKLVLGDTIKLAKIIAKHGKEITAVMASTPVDETLPKEEQDAQATARGLEVIMTAIDVAGEDVLAFIGEKAGYADNREFNDLPPEVLPEILVVLAEENDLPGFFKSAQKFIGTFSKAGSKPGTVTSLPNSQKASAGTETK